MRCLILFFLLLAASVQAGAPQLLNFQGRLTDDLGAPLDTTIAIDFAIFDDTAGTTELWAESHPSVVVRDGIFQVLLGNIEPFKETVFDGAIRYIGMAVDGKMSDSLIPIVSVAYAMNAALADTSNYAHRSRRADTATVALSGGGGSGGGWVDGGSEVTLENIGDSVGIGVADPAYPLDVEGATNAIRGKSNGTGLAVGVTGINENDGIGLFGYSVGGHGVYGLATGGKAGWFQGDAYVYGTLGLNIENPEERFHIYESNSGGRAFLKVQSNHPSNWGEAGLRIETPQNRWHLRMDDDENGQVPDGGLSLRSQDINKEVMTWTSDGMVGINDRTPEYTLDVHSSETAVRGYTTGSVQASGVLGYSSNDGIGVTGSSTDGVGVFGVSTTNYAGYFVGPTTYISGDLGIGESSPDEKLHLAGNVKVDDTLEAGAIFSTSISDEAGVVANMVGSGSTIVITSSVQNIVSAQLDVPGPGVVVAMATTSIDFDHTYNDHDQTIFAVSNTSGAIDNDHKVYLFIAGNVGTGDYYFPLTAQGVFNVSTAGSHTFYFVGYKNADAFVRAWNSHLTPLYFPTTYGTVATASKTEGSNQSLMFDGPTDEPEIGSGTDTDLDALRTEVAELRKEIEALKK